MPLMPGAGSAAITGAIAVSWPKSLALNATLAANTLIPPNVKAAIAAIIPRLEADFEPD